MNQYFDNIAPEANVDARLGKFHADGSAYDSTVSMPNGSELINL